MDMLDNLFIGKLVKLTGPKQGDHEIMVNWGSRTDYQRLLSSDPARPYTVEGLQEEDKESEKRAHRRFNFRLRTVVDDKLIGFAELFVEWNHQNCWLAIGIGDPEYWGKGYGSEAVTLLVNYAFRELNLYKVCLDLFEYNPRAYAAYLKVGFIEEGRRHEQLLRDGRRWDLILMGITRPQWEAR
ncbi:MAG: GNAT family protein [Anaerolineae bacterium]|nr:GNAT family N-acetyltransferase [Anaerolineae bacterium]